MKILALEFSGTTRSVAVASRGADDDVEILSSVSETDFRGVTGLTLVERALERAARDPRGISRIAIGLGPGSYTGIRSAIAIAQGWQLGRHIPVTGVSSLLCIAEESRKAGIYGTVFACVDAQRGDLYIAQYDISKESSREVSEVKIVPAAELPRDGTVVGPEITKYEKQGVDVVPAASTLARLAFPLPGTLSAETLEPIYLRAATFVKAPPARIVS